MTCTLENVARAGALFTAGYPSAKRMDEGTVRVWAEALYEFNGRAVEQAAKRWITTETRYPTLAGFIEAIRAQHIPDEDQPRRPMCVVCEDGWVEVSSAGRGTVQRCPNGCRIPRSDEPRPEDTTPLASRDWFERARDTLAITRPYRRTPGRSQGANT